ncbi:MFS transporter [Agromyces aerolatus]|uniref:MFS transporter n=1 Tax=Agromyces sp. LY-1074 TaxID=3074080 RepID=UPI00286477CA|nr:MULTISPECIES: MFS transporter [unclassified Agromyces]MDR5699008.1 MFS transporter [Agromyces sp. LY-1074]MDR5705214.1 MFS transporter [Agromyces sp. LY-1358]
MPRSRLLWSLLVASLTLNVMYGAIAGILVPAQVAVADPEGKELTLAMIMTASSLVTFAVHPLAGALSDRTRTRWGRRSPWIAGGAVASALAMIGLGQAEAVWAIALGWLVLQPFLNTVEAPLDAVVADRVDRRARPRAAAVYGGAAAVGIAIGAGVAGQGAGAPAMVYPVLAVVFVVVMVGFTLTAPDRTTTSAVQRSTPARVAWRSRDLRLVFAARFAMVLGHQLVMGYLLYVVMAFTGAAVADAGATVSLLIGTHIACIAVGAVAGSKLIGDARRPWIIGSSVVLAVALLAPIAMPNLAGLLLFATIGGLGRGIYLSADLALMIDVLPSSADHGRDLGVLGLATIVPQMLAPAIAGVLLTVTGGVYPLLFGLASVLVLCSVPFIARVDTSTSSMRP